MSGSCLSLVNARKYSVYVLFTLLAGYLLNQLDRYALGVTSKPMAHDIKFGDKSCMVLNETFQEYDKFCVYQLHDEQTEEKNATSCRLRSKDGVHVCSWDYDGNGEEFQILVGPVFVIVYTISGIPLGFLASKYNRRNIFVLCLVFWSLMTLLTGFATRYWHLVATRFLLGIGEAGCTPFATGLIAEYFPEDLRGAALGVYNWGIYTGFSMSFALGNFIVQADIAGQGWRWVYWIAGAAGILLAIVMIFTVKEPRREIDAQSQNLETTSGLNKIKVVIKVFLRPSLLILCLAGAVRNGAGYVWGYNTQLYFQTYYPDVNVGVWMSWVPLVGGSLGTVLGGFISDKLVANHGCYARLIVLVLSQLAATPFALGSLYLPPPWAFISLIPKNIIGEMWVGVTLALVMELVPSTLRTVAVAVYLFIISIIGGNTNVLIPMIQAKTTLRTALLITYALPYMASSFIFLLSGIALWCSRRNLSDYQLLSQDGDHSQGVEREEDKAGHDHGKRSDHE